MSNLDSIRDALTGLKLRLAHGEIDDDAYRRQRDLILADLTPDDLERLGVTPTPRPASGVRPGPSGGKTRTPSLTDLELSQGTLLFNQWRIVRELGRGGFGAVFEAEEVHLGETHAVKVLDPAMVANQDLLARFRREVSVMRGLSHRRVVRVFDYREDPAEHLALISMEFVRGCNARELVELSRASGEPVPTALALEIFAQTLEALVAAHANDIIHRDVTPGNILLAGGAASELLAAAGANPGVKLVDFGIAALADRSELSHRSRVLGTAAYVAPEVLDTTAQVTTRADLYGAGAMAYELLTGKTPLVTGHRPVGELCPGLPSSAAGVVMGAIAIEQERRPTAAAALQRLREGEAQAAVAAPGHPSAGTSSARRQPAPEAPSARTPAPSRPAPAGPSSNRQRWPPYLAIAAVAVVLAIAGILGLKWLGPNRERAAAVAPTATPTVTVSAEPQTQPAATPPADPTAKPRETEARPQPTPPPPTATSVPATATPKPQATDVPATATPKAQPTAVPETSIPRAQPTAVLGIQTISDEELVDRLQAVATSLGAPFAREPYEFALRADPVYVLTSETRDFYGTLDVAGCMWVPVARGQQAPGSYYDRELLGRMLSDPFSVKAAGPPARAAEAKLVADELLRRISGRTTVQEDRIRAYLRKHPELSSQRLLLGSVLAWAGAGGSTDTDAVLDRARLGLEKMQRGPGYAGHWYGVVSQNVYPDPPYGKLAFNLFAYVQVEADGDTLRGGGKLGNGNEIVFSGTIDGAAFSGSLTNLTIGLEFDLSGQFSGRRFVVNFAGVNPDGSKVTGRAVMLR